MKNKIIYLIGTFLSLPLLALESDPDQPIYIDSNSASYDDAKQVSIYTGNVIATQGSIKIRGDRLVIYLKNGDVSKLVTTGNPAHFQQSPGKGKDDIKAQSLIGEYYPERAELVLKKKAKVTQGSNTYTSELIRYDSRHAIVRAGEKSSDSKRVRVILQPKKKK